MVLGVHRDGGFSEYAVVPAKNAWQVPNNVTDRHAVMIEPFTIAANVTGHVSPTDQDIALVYGAGPMGLTTIQVLKRVYRVKQVIVVDRIDERLEMAQRNGADWVINNSVVPLTDTLKAEGTTDADYRCGLSSLDSTRGGHPGFSGGENCFNGILDGAFAGCTAGYYRQGALYFLVAS